MPKTTALAAAVIAAMAVLSPVSDAATRLQKTFGNWQVDCTERDANSPKVCSLQFALVNKNDKQVVFSWTVVRKDTESESNKVVVRTPTGVLLADGQDHVVTGNEHFAGLALLENASVLDVVLHQLERHAHELAELGLVIRGDVDGLVHGSTPQGHGAWAEFRLP